MQKVFFIALISVFTIQAQEISFKKKFSKDSVHLDVINHMYGPVEIDLSIKNDFKKLIKTKGTYLLQAIDTIKNALNLPLTMISGTSKIDFNRFASFNFSLGDSKNTKHNNNYRYALPYQKGKKYKIIQTFKGKFSHSKESSRYAIDFGLQIGDTICAAREGIVVRTRNRFDKRGGRDFIDKANIITILHDDGTMAAYVHLVKNGALVKPGDVVKKGQPIGISGFTGFTTTPHLHFVVREKNIAVPIYFEGYENTILKKGKKYKRKY